MRCRVAAVGYHVGVLTTILFDFFGTLVEYEHRANGDRFQRSYRWFVEQGGRLDYDGYLASLDAVSDELEAAAQSSHDEYPFEAYASAFLAANGLSPNLAAAFRKVYIPDWNAGVRYSEAVHSAIHTLSSRHALGVVTNTHLEWLVPSHLERMSIAHHFQHVVTSIEHGKRKPHAEIFEHALARFDCPPGQALFVGDSLEADYHGARNAGIRAILVDPAGAATLPRAHAISSVAHLPALLGL